MVGIRIGIRALALVAFAVSAGARAGVEIVGTENVESGAGRGKADVRIMLEGDFLRMDRKSGKEDLTVLFDAKKRVMTLVNHKEKQYLEMTAEDMQAMKKKMTGMMSMLENQMKAMPPAQRAQMEKMLKDKGMMPGKAQEKREVRYVNLARQSKTGRWNTSHYEARVGVERVAEYRVASWSELGVVKGEFRAAEAMQKFGKEMVEGLPGGLMDANAIAALNVDMNGFPVKVVNYSHRVKVVSTVEYSKIEKKSVSSADMAVPAGYAKKEMPKS